MCGIVGYINDTPTEKDIRTLACVITESQVRGMHASGAAWVNEDGISSLVKPIPSGKIVHQLPWEEIVRDGIRLIAHSRYSTSDINYNQPLIGNNGALVHNGVISQDPKENWEWDYATVTRNDSELLLRCIESGDEWREKFPEASIAALYLSKDGNITAFRNGLRSLWKGRIGSGIVYASTFHILSISGVEDIQKLDPEGNERVRRVLH